MVRTELEELKSRPALLGACTSCPVLHGKLDEPRTQVVSLEAASKSPIATACLSCETTAVKKLELEQSVNCLQDENDHLWKLLGWLSGLEP